MSRQTFTELCIIAHVGLLDSPVVIVSIGPVTGKEHCFLEWLWLAQE
jgi:hypothetical protein